MCKILAIDTSTESISVAILADGKTYSYWQLAPRQHTQLILPQIQKLLIESNISISQLNAIGFSAGPGSFAGIRVGTGVAQGLSLAHEIPLIPVSSLALLAQQAYRTWGAEKVIPALDARMNQVYFGAYEMINGIATPLMDDEVSDPDKITIPKGIGFCALGPGWDSYKTELSTRLQDKLIDIQKDCYPNAKDILPIAQKKWEEKETLSAEKAEPIYLRNQVAKKSSK